MAIKKDKVDAVIVGFGWTGAILGQELTDAGLNVVALERGAMRDTPTDAQYPKVIDELEYSVRGKLFQELARETVTIRHTPDDLAVPYRQNGSFLLGNGVGGAGFHWNGMHYRILPEELKLRSHYEERYGKKFIPEGMTIQDFGVTYEELEPHFDFAEKVFGTSGKAGNLNGKIVPGGNPREGARSSEYPTPPLQNTYGATLFEKAAREVGFNPYPAPAANTSQPYTNPYGVRLGPCNFCGFCENYGCYMYSKASPQTTILPVLLKKPNFELRPHSYVVKVNLDSEGKKATGVTYIDAQGREVEQPADIVIMAAYQLHNVRLLLLSGIGKPYDPKTGEGVVGKNYAYQMNGAVNVLLPKGTQLNPFIGTGAGGVSMDDLNGDQFDHGPLGFIGGASIRHVRYGGRPIKMTPTVPGTPAWGSKWKAGIADAYQRYMTIGISGSVMSYRDACLDLDPTYKDAYGVPLLRMTFDWHDNEYAMLGYMGDRMEEVGKAMNPEKVFRAIRKKGTRYDTRIYQSTHTTGGAIMGTNPSNSVVNKYLQSWDVSNVFVMGASAFPQNMGYNPTGVVAALAYWSAKAIREQYLKNAGPLVQA
ncbi:MULTISPECIES: GMC family oxidoreductase [Pandoraea]|jgi:gluconate 2-dehydrogenase alpha chain|uniref:GMC family oxidoreductase n=1 Tax=Pandoraea pnomenusa TaxID=93220 RepID=A0A378YX03_9BURK|nr:MULTISPECIES: GMC family oxidoreductase [Pandoraea]AHB06659.1 GMC family oxidoreductase [Pandoraea pnomenusa 3kgm]AHB77217.1 GMC family oxidoreductase [Pandoraea pnomenusa]AHN74385.1 GMC family oxidoreductase [Pandoraea pnomenusa]AIU29018.1 GMC family oxidoreductase [Pandoraea pnomenusa]ANC45992.1 GMC family oxidoreductase [Pandoraea pnomenusa]